MSITFLQLSSEVADLRQFQGQDLVFLQVQKLQNIALLVNMLLIF